MMNARSVLAAACLAGCLAACTTVDTVRSSGEISSQPGVALPPHTPNLTASVETLAGAGGTAVTGLILPSLRSSIGESATGAGLATAVAGSLLYFLYDPLAPNWTIREQTLDGETYRLSLRAKNFRVGGDGEAIGIIRRRALQLQREKGYAGYRLTDYSESVESATPFAYRVSEGTIQLVKVQ
ncbi:MAG: hypothetical protein LBE85_01205 [Candidatus Accumulibacter sp.]|jgi:hypothetical protein|nr:hypothetical protein [Accumulibacter sp.]